MERLELKRRQFKTALSTLGKALQLPFDEVVRDAVIQRFEYTFELCWKTLSLFLREVHGIDCRSPKGCFREAFHLGMYDAETAEQLLWMVDRRNETVHTYNERLAEEVYTEIRTTFYPLMEQILERISLSGQDQKAGFEK